MHVLNNLSVALIRLPFKARFSIVVLSFFISISVYWVIFPRTHNGAIIILPIALAAWLFGYRWAFIWMGIIQLTLFALDSLMIKTIFWPFSFVLIAISGSSGMLAVGLLIGYLRYIVDMVEAAQKKALLAEQQRILADQQRQEAQQAEEQQRHLNKLKDQFVVNVSHELRTPLTSVGGYLELLKEQQGNLDIAQQARFVEQALESCNELTVLVNTILDAVDVTSEVRPPQTRELSIVQTTQEVLEGIAPQEREVHTIFLDISEQLTVRADQQYMHQVLRNLLSNAFKYSPKHTPIFIRATPYRGEENQTESSNILPQVCIQVKDAGPGIPADELPLLFGKFVRLKRDLSGSIRGTGLGLYISKQLVEAMNGRIWVESSGRAGEGSVFSFTLPGTFQAEPFRQRVVASSPSSSLQIAETPSSRL